MQEQPIDTRTAQLILTSESEPLETRFEALGQLKPVASASPATSRTLSAIEAIASCFCSSSALLKHECAFELGQSRQQAAIMFLQQLLQDAEQDLMSRHEAAQSLGALGSLDSVELLKSLGDSPTVDVPLRETCEVAVARIKWETSNNFGTVQSIFGTVDAAPVYIGDPQIFSIPALKDKLCNKSLPLFERYRAMFTLRDRCKGNDIFDRELAVGALCSSFSDQSTLLRHELAFVLGQLEHPASIPCLFARLCDMHEHSIVRHEAAEALGHMKDTPRVLEHLRNFQNDEDVVVRESIAMALL